MSDISSILSYTDLLVSWEIADSARSELDVERLSLVDEKGI